MRLRISKNIISYFYMFNEINFFKGNITNLIPRTSRAVYPSRSCTFVWL